MKAEGLPGFRERFCVVAQWEWVGGTGSGVNMVCMCLGVGVGGPAFFSWPQIVLPESQERTSFSQGHTVRGGGGGPRNPGFAAEVHSVGVEGVGRSPRNSQLSFFSEGARWVEEKWVG